MLLNSFNKNILLWILFPVTIVIVTIFSPTDGNADYVKITGAYVNVRQGPGTTYPILIRADRNQEFELLSTEGLWCKILIDNGNEAWIYRNLVEIKSGNLPGKDTGAKSDSGDGTDGKTGHGISAARIVLLLVILTMAGIAVWRRKELAGSAGLKMKEISGYKKSKPFHYDNGSPDTDKWEM